MIPNRPSQTFYVTLRKRDGEIVAHRISRDPPVLAEGPTSQREPEAQPPDVVPLSPSLDFAFVFRTFVSMMESYRKFIPLTFEIAPIIYSSLAEQKIVAFLNAKGIECVALSNEMATVYELPIGCYPEFKVYDDEIKATNEGARLLPEVMVVGLVSSYDAFLSQLIRVVLNRQPEIVLTSEKTIKFSELSTFSSIEEARATLIDREVETAIRSSHHEQFSWMESRFSIKLREDLPVWPHFIELCERRNLLTHTGGLVSAQYLANCKAHKTNVTGIQIGAKLEVDSTYFSQAVSIIYEIGAKLCHVLWRKFLEKEREAADRALSDLGYALMHGGAYDIAESLLHFGTHTLKKHSSDSIRRVMIVNLANTLRLQERDAEAKKILDKEDRSAVDNNFKICVAAVYGDIDRVLSLMPIIGANGKPSAEDYRTWPVFIGMRTDKRFVTTFEDIFGEPLITTGAVKIDQTSEIQDESAHLTDDPPKKTLH
jgi:hypothetical protein